MNRISPAVDFSAAETVRWERAAGTVRSSVQHRRPAPARRSARKPSRIRSAGDCYGVVIFATNLATNFDPAFERRIRTHVLFEMPGPVEREQIWRVQLQPSRTPLAAAAEPGPDSARQIHPRHFEAGITDVVAGRRVMRQSLFADEERSASQGLVLAEAAAASRLVIYAPAFAGAAFVIAVIALVVALLK